MRWIIRLLLNAIAIFIVSRIVPGFVVDNLVAAALAAAVIGFINATIGTFIKIVTFPLTVLTFGVFWFVISGLLLLLASWIVPGFHVRGFWPAFIGSIVLAIINMVLRWIVIEVEGRPV